MPASSDYQSPYTGAQVDAAVSTTLSVTNWSLLKGIYTSGGNIFISGAELATREYVDGLSFIPLADGSVPGIVSGGNQIIASSGALFLAPGVLSWTNLSGVPSATSNNAGIIAIATFADVSAGVNNTKAVTPYTLNMLLGGDYNDLVVSSEVAPIAQSAGFITSGGVVALVAELLPDLGSGVTTFNNASGAVVLSAGSNLSLSSSVIGGVTYFDLNAENGLRGPAGPATTLTVAPVTTLDPGSSATVQITGSAPNQTLFFGIPRGSDGSDGSSVSIEEIEDLVNLTMISGGYTTSGAIVPLVSNAGYITSGGVVPIVSSAGYTTSGAVLELIAASGGGVDSGTVLNIVSNAGYITSGGVVPIVSAGMIANSLTVESTYSVDPSSNASVAIAGTAPHQSLTFYIPRGSDGTAGSGGGAVDTSTVRTIANQQISSGAYVVSDWVRYDLPLMSTNASGSDAVYLSGGALFSATYAYTSTNTPFTVTVIDYASPRGSGEEYLLTWVENFQIDFHHRYYASSYNGFGSSGDEDICEWTLDGVWIPVEPVAGGNDPAHIVAGTLYISSSYDGVTLVDTSYEGLLCGSSDWPVASGMAVVAVPDEYWPAWNDPGFNSITPSSFVMTWQGGLSSSLSFENPSFSLTVASSSYVHNEEPPTPPDTEPTYYDYSSVFSSTSIAGKFVTYTWQPLDISVPKISFEWAASSGATVLKSFTGLDTKHVAYVTSLCGVLPQSSGYYYEPAGIGVRPGSILLVVGSDRVGATMYEPTFAAATEVELNSSGLTGSASAVKFSAQVMEFSTESGIALLAKSGAVLNGRSVLTEMCTFVDSTNTMYTIPVLSGGTSYIFTQPLSSLVINSVVSSVQQAALQFTLASGGQVVVPSSCGFAPVDFIHSGGKSYLMAVLGGNIVNVEYTPGASV